MSGVIESLNGISERVRHLETTEDYDIGNGAPSHFAAEGRRYWDCANDACYMNNNGLNGWTFIGGTVPPGVPHAVLSATHTDSTPATVVRGDLITGQDTAGVTTWQRLGLGIGNAVLMSDGLDAYWGMLAPWHAPHDLLSATHTDTLASAVSQGSLVVGNNTPLWAELAIGGAATYLRSDGADPSWAAITTADITDLAYAVPALTLGVANAAGVANTVLRTDATILAFDAVNPVTLIPDAAAAVGVATVTARRDHGHAIACAAPVVNLSVSSANAEGAGNNFARSTHSHAITSSSNPGAAASILATAADGGLQLLRLGIGTDPDANNAIKVTDDTWIGLDVAAGRIVFDSTPAPDVVQILTADFGVACAPAAARVEIEDGGTAHTVLTKITQDDENTWGIVIGNDTWDTTDTNGLGLAVRDDGTAYIWAMGAAAEHMCLQPGGFASNAACVGIGRGTAVLPAARLDIVVIAGVALEVLKLEQQDTDDEFIHFQSSAAVGDLTRAIVDEGDQGSQTLEGWLKILVTDDGDQVADQAYFVPFYSLSA